MRKSNLVPRVSLLCLFSQRQWRRRRETLGTRLAQKTPSTLFLKLCSTPAQLSLTPMRSMVSNWLILFILAQESLPLWNQWIDWCIEKSPDQVKAVFEVSALLGFHSRDETAMLVYKTRSKMLLKFCTIIATYSKKTFWLLFF